MLTLLSSGIRKLSNTIVIFRMMISVNYRRKRIQLIAERNESVRSRESVPLALVKAFQVFHPTKFELLRRRARRLEEGRHYFSVKSRMNRSRRRVGFRGPTVSFARQAAVAREHVQKSVQAWCRLVQNAPGPCAVQLR